MEETQPYEKSLDVLAHQIAGYLMDYEVVESCDAPPGVQVVPPVQGPRRGDDGEGGRHTSASCGSSGGTEGSSSGRGGRGSTTTRTSPPSPTRRGTSSSTWRTTRPSGYSGRSSCMLQAKVGLHFILKGRIWQMEKIAERQEDLRHFGRGPARRGPGVGRRDAARPIRARAEERRAEEEGRGAGVRVVPRGGCPRAQRGAPRDRGRDEAGRGRRSTSTSRRAPPSRATTSSSWRGGRSTWSSTRASGRRSTASSPTPSRRCFRGGGSSGSGTWTDTGY